MSLGSQHTIESVVKTGALVLGPVRLRGLSTDQCREPWGLERRRPPPVFSFLDPGYLSGKFHWMGRSSSQRQILVNEARRGVFLLECNKICAFQRTLAVYPLSMIARYLYQYVHVPETLNWVV